MRAYHTTWMPTLGACLLIPSGPPGNRGLNHLHVVVTAINPAGEVLLVPITGLKGRRRDDNSCILEIGEHDFIWKRSYASYATAEVWPAKALIEAVRNRRFPPKPAASRPILARIREGGKISKHLDEDLRAML